MIEFFVGSLYGERLELNLLFDKIMKENQSLFNKDYKISVFYGSFENSIWNGGRANKPFDISFDDIKNNIDLINQNGISVRYTFTNSLIKSNHLNDQISNKLMELANNGMNGVIVASEDLYNYLKEKYPNFHYVYSITNCSLNIEDYNKAYDKYDTLVLDQRLNKNIDFLKKLKGKEKIEILINHFCPINCPNIKKHYLSYSIYNLYNIKENYNCLLEKDTFKVINYLKEKNIDTKLIDYYLFLKALKKGNESLITREELKWYINNGFNKFKISSRHIAYECIILIYVYYFSKEGCSNKIFDILKNTKFGKYSEFVRKDYFDVIKNG